MNKKIGTVPIFLLLAVTFGFAKNLLLTNFDTINNPDFSFKDDKGTTFEIFLSEGDEGMGKVFQLRYGVTPGGWAGWGLILKDRKDIDGKKYTHLTLMLRGIKGGEKFQIGLKDRANIEKKIEITDFTDIGPKWQKASIPLSSFSGVNLSELDNINLSFNETHGAGIIFADDIQFESAPTADEKAEAGLSQLARVTRVIIDGFERASPFDTYVTYEGDDSRLTLSSSRLFYSGEYSMEMEYLLSTNRPWGSWVSARWQAYPTPLDWTGVDSVKLWVKGDGTDNIFSVSIFDEDGEMWTYSDADVLSKTAWTLMTAQLADFILAKASSRKNGLCDLKKIRGYELTVSGKDSISAPGSRKTAGRIYIDQLYVTGAGLSAVWAAPPEMVEKARLLSQRIGNIDLTAQIYSEYFYSPEESGKILHWAKIAASGRVGSYSGRAEFASDGITFDESAYYSAFSSSAAAVVTQSPIFRSPALSVMGNNLSGYFSSVILGNLWFDYSPWTFSPVWGYKGISSEGDVENFNYHLFYIKGRFDSYAAGLRVKTNIFNTRLSLLAVWDESTARIPEKPVVANGTISRGTEWDIRPASDDAVYSFEAVKKLFLEKVTLSGTYGVNEYNKYAETDFSDPFNPAYSVKLDRPLKLAGEMKKLRVESDGLFIKGLRLQAEYRDIGPEFKPKYRQNPTGFDDSEGDLDGYNLRLTQWYRGFVFSGEGDSVKRGYGARGKRDRINAGVGYFGFQGLDAGLNFETRFDSYTYVSSRSGLNYAGGKDEQVESREIYFRTQFTPGLSALYKIRQDTVFLPKENKTRTSDTLYLRVEYFVSANARVTGEFQKTRFGEPGWEPKTAPFTDNYARLSLDINF